MSIASEELMSLGGNSGDSIFIGNKISSVIILSWHAPHISGHDDQLVRVKPLLDMVSDWQGFLSLTDKEELALLKRHESSGRPLGDVSFVERLEAELDRLLRPLKRGPKPKGL